MPESKEPLAAGFISILRLASRFHCPLTGCNDVFARIDDRIRDHLQSKHCHLTEGKDLDSIIRDLKRGQIPSSLQEEQLSQNLSPSIIDVGSTKDRASIPNEGGSPITITSHTRARSNSPPRRSRAKLNIAGEDPDFLRRPKPSLKPSKPQTQPRRAPLVEEDDEILRLIKQPETRPISQEQLVAEVKGIYAGLVMVESKCIEVDKLNNEQWQALIASHRTLCHDLWNTCGNVGVGYLYTKCLLCPVAVGIARESIVTSFEPLHPYDRGGHEDPTKFKYSKYRRGRGARRNNAYWKQRNDEHDTNLFDDRELLFQDEHGSLKASRLANLDTQLKIQKHAGDDLVMSAHCARDLGLFDRLSTDFDDPCLQSISGHSTAVLGVLRNVRFRLKGSSVTFRRDFWVCESLNNIVDVMIGASFIKDNFKMLFEKVKDCVSSFATWFSKKKETPEQKREREERERQQQIAIKELEIKRLQKESEALRRATARNSGR